MVKTTTTTVPMTLSLTILMKSNKIFLTLTKKPEAHLCEGTLSSRHEKIEGVVTKFDYSHMIDTSLGICFGIHCWMWLFVVGGASRSFLFCLHM